ncbi:MAG TPA: ASCH domain-containing protein [Patescibacteria group bacterium]|nr:ASCH domain-containing protein [Patescibacteria group bacterium]
MNKRLKFSNSLVSLVLSGVKVSTWRLWDDKNLLTGDVIDFIEHGTNKHFATAKLLKVIEKPMGQFTNEDKEGHEKFNNDNEMYETYTRYYGKKVNSETPVKIIWFKLV